MDSFKRFTETQLPPQQEFYLKLTNYDISEADYRHEQNIWQYFNIQNMGEYHDLYLETDVILVADTFESFRDVCNGEYDLDPS